MNLFDLQSGLNQYLLIQNSNKSYLIMKVFHQSQEDQRKEVYQIDL